MTVRPGFPAVSGAATFQDIRRGLAGTVVKSAAGALRTGILPIGTGPLMVGTASMVVNVQSCVVVLDRNGVVFLPNDGVQAVQLSSAPSSGSRWSIVYAKQRETEAPFSDSVAGPLIDKVESTNSETAARNLLPAGARELGVWKVDAGATTTNAANGVTYTETAPYTAMEGGIVLLRNQTEQDAWAPHDGSDAIRMDTGIAYRRIAGTWRQQTSARHNGLAGSAIVNIDVPQGQLALPAGVQIKTGQLTVGTTVEYGNEYFPTVIFDTAFPTAALSVFITPIYQGIVTGPQMSIGIDTLNVGGFRALIKGSANPWIRSFVWTAIGY